MNNAVFGKTVEIARKNRDIKLVTTERTSNYLISERNHHTTKCLTKNLLVRKVKRKKRYLWISLSV